VTGRAAGAPIDLDMQVVLEMLDALGRKPIPSLSPKDARQQPGLSHAALAVLGAQGRDTAPPRVAQLEYRFVPGADTEIGTRIFTPVLSGPAPLVLYIPDGGWVMPELDEGELAARALTRRASAVVVLMNYRPAPEHRFPAAHDDAFVVYRWLREHARFIGGDPDRIIVAGEGAGANMAANVALRARDEGLPMPAHQLLICPVAGTNLETESYLECEHARPLDKATMAWCFRHLLGRSGPAGDPRLALAGRADLAGLPPATVITAAIDPLRSEGEALVQALERARVPVRHQRFDGVTHGFFGLSDVVARAGDAVTFAADSLAGSLAMVRAADTSIQPSVAP